MVLEDANASFTLGVGGDSRPKLCIVLAVGISFFFCACFTAFHADSSIFTFLFCFFVLFHSCCSDARVFGKMLLHEFHISYRV